MSDFGLGNHIISGDIKKKARKELSKQYKNGFRN
jgi:hypothetical protein